MKKEWCMCYWNGRPTADSMFSVAYAAEAPWNGSNWEHERFNKLLKEARAELDNEKRSTMYAEMQRIVRDKGGVVIPMLPQIIEAYNEKLQHGPVSAHMVVDGARLAERWWLKS